jgi:hypothetical protein
MNGKQVKPEKQDMDNKIPSSCELMFKMLRRPPASYEPAPFFSLRITGTERESDNTPGNLLRAYLACQNGLEVSPLLSTPKFSIFVTPEEAKEHAVEAAALQKYGKQR